MAKKPRTPEEQFEHDLRTFITKKLRRVSLHWPERTKAKNAARVSPGRYKCAMCGGIFKNGEFALDHKMPVVPLTKTNIPIEEWIRGLFCRADNFQTLCHLDHQIKTSLESKIRANNKPNHKKSIDKMIELVNNKRRSK